ncbi:MAG TPA: ABC transporter ATP-binding protein [Candidatus Kapabacteria bacterium]|nr:ABC transporter ATP-binding protein [Candidatus Kapabacteria bacterium]
MTDQTNQQSGPIVRLREVTKDYELEGKALRVLRGVTVEVRAGEIVAIVGRSGAGKSTLLHIIGGLDRATSGEVQIDGRRLDDVSTAALADFRNRSVGFVFQFHHLLPEFTAVENVAMPLMIRGVGRRDALAEARRYLELVGVAERAEHKPAELSGGEQQRVAVARALVPQPRLILADEPSGNLDSETGERLHSLLWEISRREGQTFIIVTHNAALAERADRILHMRDGVLVDDAAAVDTL